MAKIQNEPNKVAPGTNSPRIGANDIPDMIKESQELTAQIKAKQDLNPPIKNSLNKVDSQVQHVRDTSDEWTIASPFKLEEFETDMTDYRGEGLLPTDVTVGNKVLGSSRIKERNHPAGKV